MKRALILLLIIFSVIGLCACSTDTPDDAQTTNSEQSTQALTTEGVTTEATTEASEPDYTEFGIPNRSEGSTLRIVSHNIRVQNLEPSKDRAEKLAVAMKYYNADILALQETDELWHRSTSRSGYGLDDILAELNYKQVPLKSESGEWSKLRDENDRNAIYYREDKVTLIKCDYDRYEATKKLVRPDCAYTWALFEENATGKKFIVLNTHFISGNEEQNRNESAKELAALVKALAKEHGAVVFVIGDLNSASSTTAYRTLTSSGLVSARTTAEHKFNEKYATTNNIGEPPKVGNAIDHILHTRDSVKICRFETLICEVACAYSDHVPMLIDIALN